MEARLIYRLPTSDTLFAIHLTLSFTMAFSHPELLIPSIIALICVLYPLPWHLRNRNVATLSMIFWMTSLNLVHIVNSRWSCCSVLL